MHAYCVKNSDFYHILTIQEYSGHNRKLSIFKQQHMNLQTEHGKGYNWHFIELKNTNMIIDNRKQTQTKENNAPRKTHIM